MNRIKPQLLDELNVKDVKWGTRAEIEALDKEGYIVAGEEIKCAVSPNIPESFKNEGMARGILSTGSRPSRRSAGFEIADHIVLYYQGDDSIMQVMTDAELGDYIKQETLADGLHDSVAPEGAYSEAFKLEGHELRLGVKKSG